MHTFELIIKISAYHYRYLHDHLPSLICVNQYVERTNFYAKKGIMQIELRVYEYVKQNILYCKYYLVLRCNLSILMGNSKVLLLNLKTVTSTEILTHLQKRMYEINELRLIQLDRLPITMQFKANRVDLAEDLIVDVPKAVIWCCNMRFPYRHYNMKRKPIPKDPNILYFESCCFCSASREINLYYKYAEIKNKGKEVPPEELERIQKTVRMEVQVKKKGIYNMKLSTKRSIQPFLDYEFTHKYLLKQAKEIFGIEKYVCRSKAIEVINHSSFRPYSKAILISIIDMIQQFHGLYELEKMIDDNSIHSPPQYGDLRSFRRWLTKIRSLGIQPVVIPDAWGIDEIPSLYKLLEREANQYGQHQ